MKKLLKKQIRIEQLKIAFTMHKDNFNNNKCFTLTTNTDVQSCKYNIIVGTITHVLTHTQTHTDTYIKVIFNLPEKLLSKWQFVGNKKKTG